MKNLWIIVVVLTLVSCKNDDDGPEVQNPTTAGLGFALSDANFNTTYNQLRTSLQNNTNVNVIAEVNQTANAQAVGQQIRNTRLIFFGNAALETPLLQANQLAGLDIPQKMLVYENDLGNVFTAYNTTAYLNARYALSGVGTLQQLSNILSNAATDATNGTVSENTSAQVTAGEGIITVVSNNDFTTTYNNLRNAVSDNLDLAIVTEIDHQTNALSVGMSLDPTKSIIFENTALVTPLIQASTTIALELPQKMLVWEESDGTVNISYTNPEYLRNRFGISGNEATIIEMKSILANLAIDAAN